MGHFKKEDEANQERIEQRPDADYDPNESAKQQIRRLRVIQRTARQAAVQNDKDIGQPYLKPLPAWSKLVDFLETELYKEEYLVCIHGTVGCIVRHKHYDHCSDDPAYSN